MGLFKSDPQRVDVLGREFRCVVCQHDLFHRRQAKMNTTVATFLNLDWTDPTALCVVCAQCGYVHWFMDT